MLEQIVSIVSDALYGYILIILLIVGGIYFTVRTRFAQFRLFREQLRAVTEKPKDGKGVSSFQALMVSTASRVGTGNIVGVSTALCLGGFGSVFWMWIIAVIGSASALIESTLAQIYKKKGPDGYYGGPAYYIETALKNRVLAVVFSVFLIVTYGFGFNMLASYNLQSTFSSYSFYNEKYTPWIIGLILAVIVGYCLFGGGKRMIKVTSWLVPIMGIAYVLIALLIIVMNITTLPSVFARIFSEAFDLKAIFGGFSGSCIMYGIKRGLFSNEAGVGSAPNASASADVTHPIKQGLVQVLSVFIDTLLICSATAFMCMCSGVEPSEGLSGAPYVQEALSKTLGTFGPAFITVAMILFAFTTLLGNLYYVDQCIYFLLKRKPGKLFQSVYYIIASIVIFIGAGLSAGLLWDIADITMGAMTIINIPVIFILSKYAIRALKDYEIQRKQGKEPVFRAEDIKLRHDTDCWK
ncbi:MAG: alanine:cation symporter family protein [Clostridia bacterium]|nr:alanine:cation symporter family protein [Clostridia bacterium]MEE1025005.1 alanine/glycine:cation symporter family protein [Acutalibacteraceae bacterium]